MTSSSLPAATRPAESEPTAPRVARENSAATLAAALSLRVDLWAPLVEYRTDSRWTHLIEPGAHEPHLDPSLHGELADVQVWLLSWLPGQGTDLHDHGGSAGAFAVAAGALTERVVAGRAGQAPHQHTADLGAGRVRPFGPHHVHQVVNTLHEPAVSVHVYRPRLSVMNTYRVTDTELVRVGTERAGVDW